jgi:hypothetical protein
MGSHVVDGESVSRKRPAAEVAPAAKVPTAKVRMTAAAVEMRMTSTTMTTAMATMTAAMATMTAAAVTAAFGSGISSGRQHGHENNDGKPDIEFRHGTAPGASRTRGDVRKTQA